MIANLVIVMTLETITNITQSNKYRNKKKKIKKSNDLQITSARRYKNKDRIFFSRNNFLPHVQISLNYHATFRFPLITQPFMF